MIVADTIINVIGIFGGLIFVVSLMAQLRKTVTVKSAKDLSILWLFLSNTAIACGLLYGLYYKLWSIYIPNSLQLLIGLLLLKAKIYYDHKNKMELEKVITLTDVTQI